MLPPQPTAPGQYLSVETSDAQLQAACLPGWTQDYMQLSCGQFVGRLIEVKLGPVQVYRETLNQATDERCQGPDDRCTVGMTLSGRGGFLQGRPMEEHSLWVLPANEFIRYRAPHDSDIVVASLDTDALLRHARIVLGRDIAPLLDDAPLRGLTSLTGTRFRRTLGSAIRASASTPALLQHPAALRQLADDVLDACVLALGEAQHDNRLLRDRQHVHRAIVDRAREFILDRRGSAPTVTDLCEQLGMSRRGLHHAFVHVLDISPVAYIRQLRLHEVRRMLVEDGVAVSTAAHAWGFWHLGIFSQYYKAMFGELPSVTARTPGHARLRPLDPRTAGALADQLLLG
ncbi:helix-turn-helix domain-containing protein [Derxia lacustris]|uniref:helix-turn-helix domain-containing protein n=1 Tax=Derxia lacustris TaxID=764842 RepID=UPI000A174263|nr:helix-turn-helix domain-containing protein [Derxia lacustris]